MTFTEEGKNKHKCSSCTRKVGIGTDFVYYKYMNRNKETGAKEFCNY